MVFLTEIEKAILSLYWSLKGFKKPKQSSKSRSGVNTTSWSYDAGHWWSQRDSILVRLITDKESSGSTEDTNKPSHLHPRDSLQCRQKEHFRKDHFFNKWSQENWISICRRMKSDTNPHRKSAWLKDPDVALETVKWLAENMGTLPRKSV